MADSVISATPDQVWTIAKALWALVVSVIVSATGGTWFLRGWLMQLDARFDKVGDRLSRIEGRLDGMARVQSALVAQLIRRGALDAQATATIYEEAARAASETKQ